MKKNAWWLRSTFAVLALGFVPAAAAEQQPKDTQAPAKEAPAKPDEHAKKLDELMQRLEKARKEFEAKAAALKDDEAALEKLYKEGQPDKAFLAEFQELAKAAKGTETAAKALVQVLWIGGQEDEELAKATVTTLIDEHIASPEIAVLVFLAPYLLGEEEGPKALEKIKAKNTTKPVLAALAFPRTARADLAPESPGCGGARSRYQCEDVVGARCLDANNDWHTCEAEPSNRTCFKPNPNYRLCAQTQQGVAQRDAGRDANPSHMDASLNDAGDFAGDAGAAPSDAGEPPLDAGEGSRDAGASCDSLIAYPCLRCTGPAKDGGCQTGAEASTVLAPLPPSVLAAPSMPPRSPTAPRRSGPPAPIPPRRRRRPRASRPHSSYLPKA